MTRWSPKDPADVRDYWVDFTGLLADDETITAATVTVDPNDAVAPFQALSTTTDDHTDKAVRARFSGGGPAKYPIEYHITTSTGQQFDLTKTLEVKERTA